MHYAFVCSITLHGGLISGQYDRKPINMKYEL